MPSKTRTRAPLTEAERDAKRQAERELLASAVKQLTTSEGWLRWLKVRTAFHTYSMNNQLLIALQNPDATRVAGFQAWLRLGRCVRKGEKALKIFAPCPPSKKQLEDWRNDGADPKQKPRTRFRLASVFDVSQVDELPPPAVVAELAPPFDLTIAGEQLAPLLLEEGPMQQLAGELGIELDFRARDGAMPAGTHGYYSHRKATIVVYTDTTANSQAATAVHELGHALVRLDRQDGDPELSYAAEELIVESVAYSVLCLLGVDAAPSSVPYLACWATSAPLETVQQHAALVDRLARRLEHALTTQPDPDPDTAPPAVGAAAVPEEPAAREAVAA